MARKFRKEFVEVFIKAHISNAELRVKKVPKDLTKNIVVPIKQKHV